MSHLQRAVEESIVTLRSLSALEEPLQRAVQLLSRCLTSGRKLLVCGNGGSASDATHLATEFLCRFKDDRRPYPAISLTANGEFMTAVCNDYHADEMFARQIWGLGEKGDVLIGFTTHPLETKGFINTRLPAHTEWVCSPIFQAQFPDIMYARAHWCHMALAVAPQSYFCRAT